MQSKTAKVIVAISIVLVIIVGGYVIFHKSSKTTSSSTTSSSTQPAVNNAVVITKTNSSVGSYLSDTSGNTLYTDGSGNIGVSNCSSSCLTAWPVYQDKGSTTGLPANVSTIKRSDNGEIQYTYKDLPLYYFSSDTPGQVTGNNVSGFIVAKP